MTRTYNDKMFIETFEREYTWKRRAEQILAFAEEVEA